MLLNVKRSRSLYGEPRSVTQTDRQIFSIFQYCSAVACWRCRNCSLVGDSSALRLAALASPWLIQYGGRRRK